MKKLLILTTVLLSSFVMTACPNSGENNEGQILTDYHTDTWGDLVKTMLDKYTTGASEYVPAIPADEYYLDFVKYNNRNAVQIDAYNVDAHGIEEYYVNALENKGFYIYNGSYTDGTPRRYAYRMMNVTDDLKVEYALNSVDHVPVFSIVVCQEKNRTVSFPDADYQYLFDTTIPTVEAESYEMYFDNTYDSYMLFAHNTGTTGFSGYYQTLVNSNKYDLVSEYSTTEQYYFTSKDGYTNIQFYEEYDEYNRLSLVVSTTTNSFRIATLRYLGYALPNFTEVLDERTSFLVSSQMANTFLIYFGPTNLSFYNSYSGLLESDGWTISNSSVGTSSRSKIMSKNGVSFQYMFGVMQDTHEETIVIAITIPEA